VLSLWRKSRKQHESHSPVLFYNSEEGHESKTKAVEWDLGHFPFGEGDVGRDSVEIFIWKLREDGKS